MKDQDKERQKVIEFMDKPLSSRKSEEPLHFVKMRIHEDDMVGFIELFFKTIEHIRITSN